MVIINKVDKPDSRPEEVVDEVFDLFLALDANDDQLDFPILYASGRDGWCDKELGDERSSLDPLLETIIAHVPAPQADINAPFAMLATLLDSDQFLGRCLTGRVMQGQISVNDSVRAPAWMARWWKVAD